MKAYYKKSITKELIILIIAVLPLINHSATAQTIFSEIYGFEPHFVPPGGQDGIKNIKIDYGAVGDGITDDTDAFLAWAEGGERTLFIPEGTYLISKQIRLGSGMKRVLWLGERRTTTIIKLMDNSTGFSIGALPIPFIYFIAPGQQGEQNMQNFIQHLTIEIGTGNPGAVALNFHTNNSGGVYDVAIRSADPITHKGHTGIGITDWGAGPGFLRFVEIDGFDMGVRVSTDNHWTLEHIKTENCNTGIKSEESTSIRKLTAINCNTGVDCSAPMVLTDAHISTTNGGTDAVIVRSNDVMIRNLSTNGYSMAINTEVTGGEGDQTGPDVVHWLAEPLQSLWSPTSGMDKSLEIPVEESPVYQYAQTEEEWALVTTAAEIQSAIDAGKTHIYLPRSTALTSEIYLRNNVKHIMFLGQSAPYTNNPTYILQDGNVEAVVIEQNAGGVLRQESPRAAVIRHSPMKYETATLGYGGKVFIESSVASWTFTNVKAWIRDADTEAGGPGAPNIKIVNSTVWILGHKTEDFATKITVSEGGFCELLGGTYRQNWDQADFDASGLDINDRPPLFLIDNASASFAAVHSWGPNIAFDPVIREIRGGETRDLSRTVGGGVIALFAGYESSPPAADIVFVTGITINPGTVTIEVGQEKLLVSTINPITATNKLRSWSSSNEAVATVDQSGFVTAVGEGTATITVTTADGNHTASSEVTVPEFIEITGISLSPASKTISVGESATLDVIFEPDNATNKKISWTSSAPSVVSVSTGGVITGLIPGTSEITATSENGGFTSSSTITVVQPGSTGLIAYEGFDYGEGVLNGQNGGIGWAGPWQGNGSILADGFSFAGVTDTGNRFGIENQEAIRVLSEQLGTSGTQIWIGFMLHDGANSPSISFNLLDGENVGMSLLRGPYDQWGVNADGTGDPDNLPYFNEKTKHHFWLFKLAFGSESVNVTVWRDPDLGTQPMDGTTITLPSFNFDRIKMTASFPGGTAVTQFDEIRIAGNFFNTRNNDAFIGVSGVVVSPGSIFLNLGESQQLSATVSPENATNKNVSWFSGDEAIVNVDNSGLVTAVGKGSTTVTALTQEGGLSATASITVLVPVTGILLDKDSTATINVGETLQLTASVVPENASDTTLTWSSDNEAIASVNENGLVEGLAPGVAVITVSSNDGNFEADCEITVNAVIGIANTVNQGFLIYPNPARASFKIQSTGDGFRRSVLTLTDITGKTLLEKTLPEGGGIHTIHIPELEKGAYLIKIFVKENNTIQRSVLVVD